MRERLHSIVIMSKQMMMNTMSIIQDITVWIMKHMLRSTYTISEPLEVIMTKKSRLGMRIITQHMLCTAITSIALSTSWTQVRNLKVTSRIHTSMSSSGLAITITPTMPRTSITSPMMRITGES